MQSYRRRWPKSSKVRTASKRYVHRIARRKNKIAPLPGKLDEQAWELYGDMDACECHPTHPTLKAFDYLDYW